MSPDDLEREAAELFRAARDEQPTAAARRAAQVQAHGALAARRRGAGRREWVAWLLAALALAGVVVYVAARRERDLALAPDPARALGAQRPLSSAEPTPSVARRAVEPPPARSVRRAPPPPPTLDEELAALRAARAALAAGNSAAALAQLDRYEGQARGGRLGAEATLLRIEALAASDRGDEAAALAAQFVEANPTNPLVDRALTYTRRPAGPPPRREEPRP